MSNRPRRLLLNPVERIGNRIKRILYDTTDHPLKTEASYRSFLTRASEADDAEAVAAKRFISLFVTLAIYLAAGDTKIPSIGASVGSIPGVLEVLVVLVPLSLVALVKAWVKKSAYEEIIFQYNIWFAKSNLIQVDLFQARDRLYEYDLSAFDFYGFSVRGQEGKPGFGFRFIQKLFKLVASANAALHVVSVVLISAWGITEIWNGSAPLLLKLVATAFSASFLTLSATLTVGTLVRLEFILESP